MPRASRGCARSALMTSCGSPKKQMLLASSLALAPGIANASPPGNGHENRSLRPFPAPASLASAAMAGAFGGDATADGRGLVIGNPHFPWNGPSLVLAAPCHRAGRV